MNNFINSTTVIKYYGKNENGKPIGNSPTEIPRISGSKTCGKENCKSRTSETHFERIGERIRKKPSSGFKSERRTKDIKERLNSKITLKINSLISPFSFFITNPQLVYIAFSIDMMLADVCSVINSYNIHNIIMILGV